MVQTLSSQNELTLMWLKFLQDLQNIQPDATYMLEHYAWFLPLDNWPEHSPYLKSVQYAPQGVTSSASSFATATATNTATISAHTSTTTITASSPLATSTNALSDNVQEYCLLRVDKPRMSACPPPDPSLLSWLQPNWSDPTVPEVECYACKLKLKFPVAKSMVHLFHMEQTNAKVEYPNATVESPYAKEQAPNTKEKNSNTKELISSVTQCATPNIAYSVASSDLNNTAKDLQSESKQTPITPQALSLGEFQVLIGASPFFGAKNTTPESEHKRRESAQTNVDDHENIESTVDTRDIGYNEDNEEIVALEIVRYTANPEWIEALTSTSLDKVLEVTFFDEQEPLVKAFNAWSRQRQLWQQVRSAEQITSAIYTKLQLAFTTLQQSSSQVELLLGNGLLRAVYKDVNAEHLLKSSALDNPFAPTQGEFDFARNLVIAHPILLKPVRLCFDERLESFTLYDTNLPCRLYQPALQALEALVAVEQSTEVIDTKGCGESAKDREVAKDSVWDLNWAFDLSLDMPNWASQATLLHPLERIGLVKFLEQIANKLPRCLVIPQASYDLSLLTNYTCMLSLSPCLVLQSVTPQIQTPMTSLMDKVSRGALLSEPALQLLNLAQDEDSKASAFGKVEVASRKDWLGEGNCLDKDNCLEKDDWLGAESKERSSVIGRLSKLGSEQIDLLLPYDLNPQQLALVERATKQPIVLAQAPIGSGKSYTAAAIVGQALAQGKSVLVTSACESNLNNIVSFLGSDLSKLCGRLGTAGIEAAAYTLQSLVSCNVDTLKAELHSLQERRINAFHKLLSQRIKLFNWLNSENIEIVFQAQSYTCRQLYNFVKEHADLAKVIPFTPKIEQGVAKQDQASKQSYQGASNKIAEYSLNSLESTVHVAQDDAKDNVDTNASIDTATESNLGASAITYSHFELESLSLSLDELKELYATNESVPAQYEDQLKLAWPELKALPQPEQFLNLLQALSKVQQSLNSSQVWHLELNLAQGLVSFKTRTQAANAVFGSQVDFRLNELNLARASFLSIGQFAEIPTWIADVYKLGQTPATLQFKAWQALTQRLITWHELSTKVSIQLEGRKIEINPQCAASTQTMLQLEAALQCACKYEIDLEHNDKSEANSQDQDKDNKTVKLGSEQRLALDSVHDTAQDADMTSAQKTAQEAKLTKEQEAVQRAKQGEGLSLVRSEQFKAACNLVDRALCLNKQAIRGLSDLALALDYVRLQVTKQQAIQQWQSLVFPISKLSFESLDSENPEKVAWRFGYLLYWVLHWRSNRGTLQALWQSKYQSLGLNLNINLQSSDPKSQSLQGAVMVWHIMQQAGQELVFLTQQVHRYYRYCVSYNRVLKLLSQEQFKSNPCCSLLLQALSQRQPPLYAKAYRQMCQIQGYKAIFARRCELLERLAQVAPEWSEAIAQRRKEHGKSTVPAQVEAAWQYWQFAQCLYQITSGSPLSSRQQLGPLKHQFYELSLQYVTKLAQLKLCNYLSQVDLRNTGIDLSDTGLVLPQEHERKPNKQGKIVLSESLFCSLEHWPSLPVSQHTALELLPCWLLPMSFVLNSYDLFRKRFDVLVIDEAQALTLSASSVLLFNLAEHVVLLGDEQQLNLTSSTFLNTSSQIALKDLVLAKQSQALAHAYPKLRESLYSVFLLENSTEQAELSKQEQEGGGSRFFIAQAELMPYSLCTKQGSLYTWLQSCMTKFMWCEQFTCVPQLFNFGNQYGYAHKLQGMRQSRFSSLAPSLLILQGGKYALHILTALLKACGEQNEYASRSIGVMVVGEIPCETKLWLQKSLGLNSIVLSPVFTEGKIGAKEQALPKTQDMSKAAYTSFDGALESSPNNEAEFVSGVPSFPNLAFNLRGGNTNVDADTNTHTKGSSSYSSNDMFKSSKQSTTCKVNEGYEVSTLELLSCLVYNELSVSLQRQHHLLVGTPEFFSGKSCDVMFVVLGEGKESLAHYNMAIMHTNEQLWLINTTEQAGLGDTVIHKQLVEYAEKCQAEFAQDLQNNGLGDKEDDSKLACCYALHTAQSLVQALAQDSTLDAEQISFMQQLVQALSEHGFQLLLSNHEAKLGKVSGDDPTAIVVVYQQRRLRLECHTEHELLDSNSIIEILQRHERYEHYGYSVLHVMCSSIDESLLATLILQIQREGFQSENLRGFIYVLLHQSSVILLHKIQERALTLLSESFALDFSKRSLFAGPIAKSLSQSSHVAQSKTLDLVQSQDKAPSASAEIKSSTPKASLAQLAQDLSDDDIHDEEPTKSSKGQTKSSKEQSDKLPSHKASSNLEPDAGDYADYIADNIAKEQSLTYELERVITQSEQEQAQAAYREGPERKRIGDRAEAETELKYNYQLARIGLKKIELPIQNPLPADSHERFRAFKRFLFGMLRQMRLSYKDLLSSYQIVAVTPNAGQTQYFLRLCEYLHLRPYIFNSSKPMAKRVWCIKQSDLMSAYVHESALALCINAPTSTGHDKDISAEHNGQQNTPQDQIGQSGQVGQEGYYAQSKPYTQQQSYYAVPKMATGDENSPLILALNKALNPYWGQTVDDRQRELPQTMRALAQRSGMQSWDPPESTNQFLKEQLMPPPMRRNLNRGDVNTLAVLSMIPKEQNLPNPSKARIHTLHVTKGKSQGAGETNDRSNFLAQRRGAVQYAKNIGQAQVQMQGQEQSMVTESQSAEQEKDQLNAEHGPIVDKASMLNTANLSDSQLQAAVQQLKQVQRNNESEFSLSSIFDIPEVSSAVSASIAEASNMLSAQELASNNSLGNKTPSVSNSSVGVGSIPKQESYVPERIEKVHKDSYPIYGAGAVANSRLKRAGTVDYPGMPQESSFKSISQGVDTSDSRKVVLNSATLAARARLAEQKAIQSIQGQGQSQGDKARLGLSGAFKASENPKQGPAKQIQSLAVGKVTQEQEVVSNKPVERFNADAAVAELLMRYEQKQGVRQEALDPQKGAQESPRAMQTIVQNPSQGYKANELESTDNVVVRGSIMGIGEIEGEMRTPPSQGGQSRGTASKMGYVTSNLANTAYAGQGQSSQLAQARIHTVGTNVKSTYQMQPQVKASSLAKVQALSQAAYGSSAYRGKAK